MNKLNIEALACRQLADYDRVEPGTMFSEGPELSLRDAYAIQAKVANLRVARGERMIGYKVGCTSPTIQQRLDIDRPVFGRLFGSERYPSGKTLASEQFCQLAIEGELAVLLADDLVAGAAESKLIQSIGSVFPVIELHHLIFRRPTPSAQELVANNALQAGIVTGEFYPPPGKEKDSQLRIAMDQTEVAHLSGDNLFQTIVDSLRWLSGELVQHGLGLKKGQTILCGSIADLYPLEEGTVAVTTDKYGDVSATFVQTKT